MPLELCLAAIGGLVAAIGTLYRQLLVERKRHDFEVHQTARMTFALLGALARARGENPPATKSTAEHPSSLEARTLAVKALNGDLIKLLDEYLSNTPSQPVRVSRGR